jgi:hypothetical protein
MYRKYQTLSFAKERFSIPQLGQLQDNFKIHTQRSIQLMVGNNNSVQSNSFNFVCI